MPNHNTILSNKQHISQYENIKIVLISLYQYGSFGTRILRDVLRTHNHRVFNIFFKKDKTNYMQLPTEYERKLLIDLIKDIKPDLIGISLRSTFFPVARDITFKIKENMDTPVIWGGVHPTICPEESIEFADMICIGEGEKLMLELSDKLLNHQDINTIKNLWIKKDNSVIKNETQNLIENLDSLPLPDFEDENIYAIENDRLHKGDSYYNDDLTHYNFMTGRGCPFHCDFCSNSILKKIFENKGNFIRQRGVENVIDELKLAKKRFRKLKTISSNDEILALNKDWLKEFCRRYKDEINLPFHCDIYPNLVIEEIIMLLKDAGLKTITVGIQSGSERIRTQLYGRNTSETQLKKASAILKKFHIFPSYDLIFDNPLETENDVKETLSFMLQLPRPFRINMYSMQYHPKTKLTERLLKENLILPTDVDGVSLKGFNQWHVNLYHKNQKHGRVFLYRLFELLSSFIILSRKNPNKVMPVFPRWFIRFIENNICFRKYPQLTDWVVILPKITFGLGLLFQGKIGKLCRSAYNVIRN